MHFRNTRLGMMVQATIPMAKDERNRGFYYKYSVVQYDPKKKEMRSFWEHLQTRIFTRSIVNRLFLVHVKDKQLSGT